MLIMPGESNMPLNHCCHCHMKLFLPARNTLLIKWSLLLSLPTTLSSSWQLCWQSLWCTQCCWHWPWASLPASPCTLILFVSFSFHCFPKTCSLFCAKKTLIYALNILSNKSQLHSRFLLFHSPSSHQLSDFYHITFVLPLFVQSTSVVWMCSWNSFACHCIMSGTYWSVSSAY